jgi:large subunit ribosomal protein L4
MKAKAYTADGEERSRPVELPEALFDGTVNEGVLHQVITARRANQRQGNASTRTYATVAGGGRKPWRQKGTGRARQGTIRSPLWRGGVVTFGPQPRDYDKRVPKKLNRLAIQSALNARALEGNLLVLAPLELDGPRTRTVAALLEGMEIDGRKVLFLTDGLKRILYLSARNIPGVEVKPWGEASAYDLLRADVLVVEEGAWEGAADEAGTTPDEPGSEEES